jgi:uncharacterized protein DUF3105
MAEYTPPGYPHPLHFSAVSHRQEEKQRRREEREAQEKADRARHARRQRMQIAIGGLVAVGAIAVIALFASGTLGGDGGNGDEVAATRPAETDVTIPEQVIGDLTEAAKAAGCTVTHPKIEGAQHEERDFTEADYKTNPPTSGNHFPTWAEDGVYDPGNTPQLGLLVHTLEHGRIDVQYKPGTPQETIDQLNALLAESEGYHMLLFENPTNMDAQVAATAWGHSVTCPEMNDKVFDAIRTFRNEYIDQGPENVP